MAHSSLFQGEAGIGDEGVQDAVKVLLINRIKLSLLSDLVEKGRVGGPEVSEELGLKLGNLRGDHLVEVSSHTGEDDANLFLGNHGDLSKL